MVQAVNNAIKRQMKTIALYPIMATMCYHFINERANHTFEIGSLEGFENLLCINQHWDKPDIKFDVFSLSFYWFLDLTYP